MGRFALPPTASLLGILLLAAIVVATIQFLRKNGRKP